MPPETPIRAAWPLDALGNWDGFTEDADGDGTPDLQQDRTHNDANELTDLSGAWLDPACDAAGNLIFAPKPGAEATDDEAHLYVYDAWNRLVEVYEDADESGDLDPGEDTLVVTYEYDGQRRRIEANVEGESSLDTYYNTGWQVVETRRSDYENDPYEQYVWDIRYVDAPVLRFHDGDTDGTIDDTLYYTTDANMNVTALLDTGGHVVERYVYDAYGQVTVLNGEDGIDPDTTPGGEDEEWTEDTNGSDYENTVLFAGYRFDSETGLYHVRHRMYHATLGRWVQRDPAGYVDGMGLYLYAVSNPVLYYDPQGLAVPGTYHKGETKVFTADDHGGSYAKALAAFKQAAKAYDYSGSARGFAGANAPIYIKASWSEDDPCACHFTIEKWDLCVTPHVRGQGLPSKEGLHSFYSAPLKPDQVTAIRKEEQMHREHIRRIWEKMRNALTQERRCKYTKTSFWPLLSAQSPKTVGQVQSQMSCELRAKALAQAIGDMFSSRISNMDDFFDSQQPMFDIEGKDIADAATHKWLDNLSVEDWDCGDTR